MSFPKKSMTGDFAAALERTWSSLSSASISDVACSCSGLLVLCDKVQPEVIRLASILARVLCVVVVCGVMSAQMLMQPLGVVGIPGGAGCRGYKGMGLKIDSPWYGPWGIVGFLARNRCSRLP